MSDKLWTNKFILACSANFLMSFAFYLLMPTLPLYLTKVMGLPESEVGIVLSSYTLAMLLTRPFSGFLVDNFARKPLFIFSLSLFTFFIGGYLFATSVIIFMLLRFVHGATWAVTTVSGSTIAIDIIPSSKRAQGIGFYGLNMNISMALAPWVGLEIYDSFGYSGLIISSLLTSCLAVFVVSIMKVEPRPKQECKTLSLDRFILLKALPISFNLMLCAVSYGILISYGAIFVEDNSITNPGLLFLFIALGIGLSRIISGSFVDRGYLHIISVWSICILGVALIFFALYHNFLIFAIASLLIGVGYGSMVPAFQTLFVNMANHNQRGTANSTYLTSFDLGVGIGMLSGGIISEYKSLEHAFIIGSILCFLSIPYYLFISKPLYEKNKII